MSLPNIHDEQQSPEESKIYQGGGNNDENAQSISLKNKSNFAREVEEKLKLVLGGM